MPTSTSTSTATFHSTSPTKYLYFLITWVVLAAFNYGFGISELNPIQSVISCKDEAHTLVTKSNALPRCIPMNETQFGAVTALFTLGGLLTSLLTSPLSSRFSLGPKNLLIISASLGVIGGAMQSLSGTVTTLGLGRLIMGMSSGVGVVTVPRYLSDISPPSLRGSIGVLNQLAIVFGILAGQSLGVLHLGSSSQSNQQQSLDMDSIVQLQVRFKPWYLTWRAVPLTSALVALSQLILGLTLAVDPPSWIKEIGNQRGLDRSEMRKNVEKIEKKLWKGDIDSRRISNEESVGLLREDREEEEENDGGDQIRNESNFEGQLKISELLSIAFSKKIQDQGSVQSSEIPNQRNFNPYRKGLALILFTQLAQQFSGVNAVLYFSTGILANVLSDGQDGKGSGIGAKEIGVGITIVNVLTTFPPIFLIPENRLGRRKLLLSSITIMTLSSFFLSLSILNSSPISSSISIILFVAGFSIGLGPIPFLILPELVPDEAINASSSLGMGLNWTANFFLALGFLPLKNFFKGLDGMDGGSVFFTFTLINAMSLLGVWRFYHYEEKVETSSRRRLD